jgi:hypothetical protein
MNLALIYAKLNDANRTERCIREAIGASPNWYKPHLALSQLLLATNRRNEGEKEARLARDLNPSAASHTARSTKGGIQAVNSCDRCK